MLYHGFIWDQHDDQLPVGLLAQLVAHCTCSSSVHYCEDRFQIHVFIRSSNMTFIYSHSFNNNDNNKKSIIKGQNFNNNIILFFNDVCNEKGG